MFCGAKAITAVMHHNHGLRDKGNNGDSVIIKLIYRYVRCSEARSAGRELCTMGMS